MYKQSDDWHYELVDTFGGGLRLDTRPDKLEKGELLQAVNIVLQRDFIYKDTGYVPFADEVEGESQATFEYSRKSGVTELICVSTASVYKYSLANNQWQFVKGTASTTTTAGAAAGATSIVVSSISGFSNGNRIGIFLDNGSQHRTTINGAPAGSTITLATAIPVGRSVANGAIVVRAVVLTGSPGKQVSLINVPSHDWLVFTNFADPPQRYDSVDCVIVPNLPSSGNFIARCVALYNSALFFAGTIEGGTAHPTRVRRSDLADPTNWTTNTAGFDDLDDVEDTVMCMLQLGPYLIIYRDRSIYRTSYINSGGKYYDFQPTVIGEGSVSTGGVADVGEFHLVVGHSNLYEYRGGYDLPPIGDNIYYRLFGSAGEVSGSNFDKVFAFYVEELDECWIFVVAGAEDLPNKLYRYNIGNKAFFERHFAHSFVGFGFYSTQVDRTWAALQGSWLDQDWAWNSRQLLSASPTTHLCDGESGQVMEYNYTAASDSGATISYVVETKDFTTPFQEFRFDFLETLASGVECAVDCSIDAGVTWQSLGVITNTQLEKVRLYKQFVGNKVRFRFSGLGQFRVGWMGFSFRDETYR